jgi:hypothetical protein
MYGHIDGGAFQHELCIRFLHVEQPSQDCLSLPSYKQIFARRVNPQCFQYYIVLFFSLLKHAPSLYLARWRATYLAPANEYEYHARMQTR